MNRMETKKTNYSELRRRVEMKSKVYHSYRYTNASEESRSVYDQALQMGQKILNDQVAGHEEAQAMVDLAAQAIYNAQKALNGHGEHRSSLVMQLNRLGRFTHSQAFMGLPFNGQDKLQELLQRARKLIDDSEADQAAMQSLAIQIDTQFKTLKKQLPVIPIVTPEQELAMRKKLMPTALSTFDNSGKEEQQPKQFQSIVPTTTSSRSRRSMTKQVGWPLAVWTGFKLTLGLNHYSKNKQTKRD